MTRLVLSALLLLVSLPLQAADSGVDRMRAFLKDVHSLKAGFTQVVLDSNQKLVKQSTGTLAIKRPDRFRWDYAKPDEQIIVADGRHLWLYDVALQQVTVKPLNDTLAASPAVLLAGSNEVDKTFKVTDMGEKDGLVWVGLTPKVKDTDFDSVKLGFKDKDVAVMELKDNLGNTTRISFDHVQRNPAVDEASFQFAPPAGADVIGDTGDGKPRG
ncbi:MAG TPA: outer membrane lipoprotein chaperone LolA [Gammaproteobacteria bacterium]|jgi:outer membrane lipoprotein carrier protein|nr:outer membrane lipoprotein chaperone LolA [Gammaproteobacteria bacterium]